MICFNRKRNNFSRRSIGIVFEMEPNPTSIFRTKLEASKQIELIPWQHADNIDANFNLEQKFAVPITRTQGQI